MRQRSGFPENTRARAREFRQGAAERGKRRMPVIYKVHQEGKALQRKYCQ
jgi:hypothetical protein